VFFGRLEGRKGLTLFCDALDRAASAGAAISDVTFLGKDGTIAGRSGLDYLDERSRRWSFPWRAITNYDNVQAIDYLRQTGRVAIMPSLMDNSPLAVHECLLAQIPFVASQAGGIPEMVRADDHPTVLFPMHAGALAERLARLLREGLAPGRPAFAEAASRAAWLAWHGDEPPASRQAVAFGDTQTALPLVTVCIPHFNRPAYLWQAIESLRAQDYPNFEVVVVDDGSSDTAAIAYLDSLGPEFAARGWRLIRQENRYPGAARNNAARHARGEYLLFMDDDNFAKPHEISCFVRSALHSRADILTCFADVVEGDELLRSDQLPDSRWLYMGDSLSVGAFYNCFGDTNSLWRRESFLALGGFTEDYGCNHEDWELHAKAALRGYRLAVVPEALYWYRANPSGINLNTSNYLNSMRALRPYRDVLPASLHHVLMYARAHYGRALNPPIASTRGLSAAPENWPLRYQIADWMNHVIKRVFPLHRYLRAGLLKVLAHRRLRQRPGGASHAGRRSSDQTLRMAARLGNRAARLRLREDPVDRGIKRDIPRAPSILPRESPAPF
jgi:glycosyltransferase involved in cell wall biosynthesis